MTTQEERRRQALTRITKLVFPHDTNPLTGFRTRFFNFIDISAVKKRFQARTEISASLGVPMGDEVVFTHSSMTKS